VTLWEDILRIAPIGVHDDFLGLGGHSLKAMRLIDRAAEAFGVTLPMAWFLANATIEGMALGIVELLATEVPPDDRHPPRSPSHGD
jgi:acyl carrier protein